jgi:branched-chain amino acid transport system substrate-binding protein
MDHFAGLDEEDESVQSRSAGPPRAGTDEAKPVMAKMREIPVDDFYVQGGKLREDGRLLHDMYFVQVKTPAESSRPWDYYKIIATIPRDQAFRPAGEDGCPLIKR